MYEVNLDLLVCKLFKDPKFEDRLDIFLVEFLDPKLFFMKQFHKIYDMRLQYSFFLEIHPAYRHLCSKLAKGNLRSFWGRCCQLLWSYYESYRETLSLPPILVGEKHPFIDELALQN